MKLLENVVFMDRVICLMRRKSTGDADEFATKLNMSKRSLHRLIHEMKYEGYPIDYCKNHNSYILKEPVTYEFRVTVGNHDLLKIKGGRKVSLDLIDFKTYKVWKFTSVKSVISVSNNDLADDADCTYL